jgi:hypothetical protein
MSRNNGTLEYWNNALDNDPVYSRLGGKTQYSSIPAFQHSKNPLCPTLFS